ncbi:Hypothetical predicted protein, partial [Paramuricea clavata]
MNVRDILPAGSNPTSGCGIMQITNTTPDIANIRTNDTHIARDRANSQGGGQAGSPRGRQAAGASSRRHRKKCQRRQGEHYRVGGRTLNTKNATLNRNSGHLYQDISDSHFAIQNKMFVDIGILLQLSDLVQDETRAALTSARTTANAIYCPPKLQAALDMQSGILHAEEKDFKTAYSYFYEAFEGYDSLENAKAPAALKYMLLCKIMLNSPEDVQSIISGKLGLKYSGPSLQAMKKIADASHQRSLLEFKKILATYKEELQGDPIIQ